MAMFAFSGSILLMSMRTRHVMIYAYALEGVERLILSTPVSLNCTNLTSKLSLDKVLEITKTLKYFRFML